MHWIFLIAALLFADTTAWGAERYVKTSCTNGATTFNPATESCTTGSDNVYNTVANCLAWVTAGNTCSLASQTFTGASNMITPTAGKKGTSANRITVKALVDGAALIDGQVARIPIFLASDNDWFSIEGVNAKNGSSAVVQIQGGSENNIVRRVCAWDANPDVNNHVWAVHSNNNTLEDVCGFGTGRKIFTNSQGGNNLRITRAFGIWNGHNFTGPKQTFSNVYNATGAIYENVIGTWDGTAPDQPFGILGQDGQTSPNWESNSKYLGSIAYMRSGFTANINRMAFGSRAVDNTEFKDILLYNDPGTHTSIAALVAQIFDQGTGNTNKCSLTIDGVCDRKLTNITEVGFTAPDSVNAATWTTTNKNAYVNISALNSANDNPFRSTRGSSGGAWLCTRYVAGVNAGVPLWPWPMNARIIAAMTAGGKTPIDITAEMESIFGAIPAACRSEPRIAAILPFTTDANTIRVTFSNDTFPPLSSPDFTKFSVTEDATPLTVTAAAIPAGSTNLVDLTVTETISSGTTLLTSATAGAVQNTQTQSSVAFTNSATTNNVDAPAATAVLTQAEFRVHGLYGTEAAPILVPYVGRLRAPPGGRFRIRFNITCTDDDCPSTQSILQANLNGAGWVDVADDFGSIKIRYAGRTITTDIPDELTPTTAQLGANTPTGYLVRSITPVVTLALTEGQATEYEYTLEVSSDIVPDTDSWQLRLSNLQTYTEVPTIVAVGRMMGR